MNATTPPIPDTTSQIDGGALLAGPGSTGTEHVSSFTDATTVATPAAIRHPATAKALALAEGSIGCGGGHLSRRGT